MSEQLATFEVPRVSVDFSADDLSGREKLSVLKYLSLDDAISQIGRQRFGATTRDNIPLKPVRDWVTENWEDEFVYDLKERNVPITFRTALALALFTTRITEHLTQMGDVEVYTSGAIQKALEKHGQEVRPGLSTIDYASLPAEAKSDLVMPIIGNLTDAEAVVHAGYLFPDGISRSTAIILNPTLVFAMIGGAQLEDKITFNQIDSLGIQAAVARSGLNNIQQAKEFEAVTNQIQEKVKSKPKADSTTLAEEFARDEDEEQVVDILYDPGTSFLDVFPYQEGETSEDLLKAFKRITDGKFYHAHVDEPHRGESLKIHIAADGRLIGLYGFEDFGTVDRFQTEIDMLSDRLEGPDWGDRADPEIRRKNILALVGRIRDELDINKLAITEAQNRYGQTSFTVEKGFLEALTGRSYIQATKLELDEDRRLAKEAEKTARVEEVEQDEGNGSEIAVKSGQLVDERMVELDYSILRAIREHLDSDKLLGLISQPGGMMHIDNIGDWFASCASLVLRFQAVLIDTPKLFNNLGIQPTNDLDIIRGAYRQIAMENHPDRTSGLPIEDQVEATGRFLQATSAYRNLEARVGHINTDQLAPTYYLGRISQLFAKDIAD